MNANTNPNPFIRRAIRFGSASVATAALTFGLCTAPASASADEHRVNPVSQSAAPVSAEFWVKVLAAAFAKAEARAVVYNGTTVTAGHLLEEERTASPHAILRNFKGPTHSQVKRYGVLVHSMEEGQRVLTKLVKAYDKKVTKAKRKVGKLKLKLKHAYSASDKRLLKQKLKKARKHLKQLSTWKHKPIVRAARGTCYLNSGRLNRLDLRPFRDCVDGNKQEVVFGWVPELREAVIVGQEYLNGSYEEWCINFGGFDVPPGTPDRSLYLVVRDATKIDLEVLVGVGLNVGFHMGGRLHCPDGSVVEDEAGDSYSYYEEKSVVVPGHWDVRKVLAFGEDRIKLRLPDYKSEAEAQIYAEHHKALEDSMVLVCQNAKPNAGVRPIEHTFPNGIVKVTTFGSDYEDGGNVTLARSVTGGAEIITGDPAHPEREYTEGSQRFRTFFVRVTGAAGSTWTVTVVATDQDGNSSDPVSQTVPIPEDNF